MSTVPHVPRVGVPHHVPHVHLPHLGRHVAWVVIGVALVGLVALSARDAPELEAARVVDNLALAWSEHDPYAVSRLYTSDAVLTTVDGRELVGAEAIASEVARLGEYRQVVWHTGPVTLEGDLATTSMAYSMTDGSGALTTPVELVAGTMRSDFLLEDGKIARQWDVESAG